MLRRKAVYKQNGGLNSVTPENKAKLDAMSDEEIDEHRTEWRLKEECGRRLTVESWFSGLKRTCGDEIKSRTPANAKQDLHLKVGIYNHMIDDGIASGYTPTRVVINEGWTGNKGRCGRKDDRKVKCPTKSRKATARKARTGIG